MTLRQRAAAWMVLKRQCRSSEVTITRVDALEQATHLREQGNIHRYRYRYGFETNVTRAFTGRFVRGLRNSFMDDHDRAGHAYPQIHYITAPLRAAAAASNDLPAPALLGRHRLPEHPHRPGRRHRRPLAP